MAERKRVAHTKSRKGCLTCKKRHVRCNENKPVCGPCERLSIACEYPAKQSINSSPRETSVSSSPGSVPNGLEDINALDLQLLHFWTVNTALTCARVREVDVWQDVIVELGFVHPFLLRGILAVAAVHKAVILGKDVTRLHLQSTVHMNAAVRVFQQHLARPDPETCYAVFVFACLLPMHTLGVAQIDPPTDALDAISVWLRLLRGIKATLTDYWDLIKASPVAPITHGVMDGEKRQENFPIMVRLRESIVMSTHSHKDTLLEVVDSLHDMYLRVKALPDADDQSLRRLRAAWPVQLPTDYLLLFDRRDSMTLVIFAYFAALLNEDGTWWLRNWPVWLLDTIEVQIDRSHREWLKWPAEMIRNTKV